jgi:hypothetical protein
MWQKEDDVSRHTLNLDVVLQGDFVSLQGDG